MSHPEFNALIATLKQRMKVRNTTYKELAKALGTSVSTIKRIFSGHECNVGWLFEICSHLDLNFSDLVTEAIKDEWRYTILSDEQEELLAKRPELLRLLSSLYKGRDSEATQRKFSAQRSSARELEKAGLVARTRDGRYRVAIMGQIHWQEDGPLARRYFDSAGKKVFEHFLANKHKPDIHCFVGSGRVSEETKRIFFEELRALCDRFVRTSAREERLIPPDKLSDFFLISGLGPYSFIWE